VGRRCRVRTPSQQPAQSKQATGVSAQPRSRCFDTGSVAGRNALVPHLPYPPNFPSFTLRTTGPEPTVCHGSHAQICIFQTSRYSRFEETCTTESALRSEHYRQSGLRHLRQLGPSLDCGGRNAARMHAAGLTKSPTLASLICCSASRHKRASLQRSSWCTTGTRR
jgi:hypothetical protein